MLKGNLKINICRLCFNNKCDIDFKVVEVIKEVLEIVLPKLNLGKGDEHLICSSCSVKLFAALDFKSVCMDTEDTIFPYVNSQETSLVDLKEIYLKEKRDVQLIDILEYRNICRLCFQSVRYGFVLLNEVDGDIIDNYIPEVNFNATKDPVICKVCSDSLITHGIFLSSCLAAHEENRKVCGDPAEDGECCIKIEETKIEADCDSDPPTRLENIETIKNFDDRFSSENKPVEYKKHLLGKVQQTYTCNRCNFKTMYKGNLKRHCLSHVSLTPTYISLKSQSESESRDTSSPCPLEKQVRMFQCEKCPYRTHLRDKFARHWSTHEVPSEVKVYQCEKCYYRVTRKEHFRLHQLRHEEPMNVRTYTCNKCEFKTVHRYSMKRHCLKHVSLTTTYMSLKSQCKSENRDTFRLHQLKHKDSAVKYKNHPPGNVQIYTCNRCEFKTVHKSSLTRHCLKHKVFPTPTFISPKSQCKSDSGDPLSPSPLKRQERMYQCEKCPYRTHRRNIFARHWSTHEVPSEVKVYQCEICHYRVTREDHFRLHQLRHKDSAVKYKNHPPRNVRIYTCNRCEFKTVHRSSLTRHCLKHKVFPTPTFISPKSQCKSDRGDPLSPSTFKRQKRMYQCEKCPYRTHLRDTFAHHWSTHEVPSEVKVYQCDKCHYRVTQENYFRSHQLRHEDGGIVENYTCDKCDFQTRYKCSLVTHQLLHKKEKLENVKCHTGDDGEPMYKCNVCKYETKNRRQLLVHRCHQVSPTKQLKFKCCTCAYQSDDKDKLTRHQEKHSSGMKTLKCELCSYQTMWKSNFVRHQLRHGKNAK